MEKKLYLAPTVVKQGTRKREKKNLPFVHWSSSAVSLLFVVKVCGYSGVPGRGPVVNVLWGIKRHQLDVLIVRPVITGASEGVVVIVGILLVCIRLNSHL